MSQKERIAKVLARSGVASRRDSETLILEGRIKVNDVPLETPAFLVSPEDKISVDGKPLLSQEKTRLWLYHKPRGLITTHKDPEGRPTVFESLPSWLPRALSVGRLDRNTEGLLLLTNDGALARMLEHPSTAISRTYRVRVFGSLDPNRLKKIEQGLTYEGVSYRPAQIVVFKETGRNAWLEITLFEGKNREIRNMMAFLGVQVNRLLRLSYGPYALGDLKPGEIRETKAIDLGKR